MAFLLGFDSCDKELQLTVIYGSGEGQYIADVAHAGQIHDAALKAQTEACVAGGAVLAQIQIEVVILGLKTQLVHACYQLIVVILTLASADALKVIGCLKAQYKPTVWYGC